MALWKKARTHSKNISRNPEKLELDSIHRSKSWMGSNPSLFKISSFYSVWKILCNIVMTTECNDKKFIVCQLVIHNSKIIGPARLYCPLRKVDSYQQKTVGTFSHGCVKHFMAKLSNFLGEKAGEIVECTCHFFLYNFSFATRQIFLHAPQNQFNISYDDTTDFLSVNSLRPHKELK